MTTNIFLNSYKQPENKLTYNFLALLEIINSKKLFDFLLDKNTIEKSLKNIKTVYGGGETNPDGSFDLKLNNGQKITVFYENKTNRRGIDINQIIGHLKICKDNDILLVTSPRKSDIDVLLSISDDRIIFKTWQEISLFLKTNFSDNIISTQFVEYGKKSGEFEELGELYLDDIEIYCKYLEVNFDNKIQSIFKTFIHEVNFSKFGFNNIKLEYRNEWGRNGVEISLINNKNCTYYQFGAISLYYDTNDHEITFKENVPEIVFFLDVHPDKKEMLQNDDKFIKIIEALKKEGIENNLNNNNSRNHWRLIYYRKPVTSFPVINVQELLLFTEEVLLKLLRTNALTHKYFKELS